MKHSKLKKRDMSYDILKCICAFGIICIHKPFIGEVGAYVVALARCAVPIFFMITGFFLNDASVEQYKKQIKKVACLMVIANMIYMGTKFFFKLLKREDLYQYCREIFSVKSIVNMFFFNESPFSGHLWYLSALLYVLVIMMFISQKRKDWLYLFSIPILLLVDLIMGKYSILIWGKEFPYIWVRNFVFVGVPYFCLGALISEKKSRIFSLMSEKVLRWGVLLFTLTTLLERWVLIHVEMNATRDHYISTTFLALSIFLYCMVFNEVKYGKVMKMLAEVGRKYSLYIYILHPLVIVILDIVFKSVKIYQYVAPWVVFYITIMIVKFILRICDIFQKIYIRY